MRAAALIAVLAAGCSSLLGIEPLGGEADDDDAEVDAPPVDAPTDVAVIDTPMIDAADAAGIDATDAATIDATDAAMIDATDAAMIDAAMIDAAIDAVPIDAAAPHDGGVVTIGEYTALAGQTTVNGNFIIARRFTIVQNTTVVAAGAYLKFAPAGGAVKFAIYSDSGSAPFSRRVFSADVVLTGAPGYHEVPLSNTLPATGSGTSYWIVMAADMTVDVASADSNDVWGALQSRTYASAFPTNYSPQPIASGTSDRINLYLVVQ